MKYSHKIRFVFPMIVLAVVPYNVLAQGGLPSDAKIVEGNIGISTPSTNQMTINQSSDNGIIEWGSFSIGENNIVTFNNGSGATLNRVTGPNASEIMGRLDATGSVYLVNQNGVFIGKDGVIRTNGDFIGSTLDITNTDFLNGGDAEFLDTGTAGAIVNLGTVGSLGGNVALIARNVTNEGTVSAPNGTAALLAGREILMRDMALDHGMFVVRLGGGDTSVTDRGSIEAAAAELRTNGGNIYALAGNRNGTIRATGVAKKGGRIFLTAGAGGRIQANKTMSALTGSGAGGKILATGGVIDASAMFDASAFVGDGGHVKLFADAEMTFSGDILAYGDGLSTSRAGLAEVSGLERLNFTGLVDTGGGTLVIDPDNYEITNDSNFLTDASLIDPFTIVSNLASNNVVIHTSGTDGEAGTIQVTSTISTDSGNDLTFLAHGDVRVEADILNTGSGNVNLIAGWDGLTTTDPALFDISLFLDADIDAPSIFGNANGINYDLCCIGPTPASGSIFIGGFSNDVAVGSRGGNTNLLGNDIYVMPQTIDSGNGNTLVGSRETFSVGPLASVTGDINVRAKGSVVLEAGSEFDTFSQIGHVGRTVEAEPEDAGANVNGNILVEAGGDISVIAGPNSGAYAQIGHGAADGVVEGDMQGQVIVLAENGEISISSSSFISSGDAPVSVTVPALIGHGTSGTVSNSELYMSSAALDTDASIDVAFGGTSTVTTGLINNGLEGGPVSVLVSQSNLSFLGTDISATGGDLTLSTSGDLTFGDSFLISDDGGSSQYVFAAEGNFINSTGAGLFDIGPGTWYVYSTDPTDDTGGLRVLPAEQIVFDDFFDISDPLLANFRDIDDLPLDTTLNTFVYTAAPIFTVGDASFTYGNDASFSASISVSLDAGSGSIAPVVATDYGFDNLTTIINEDGVTRSGDGFVNAGTYAEGIDPIFDAPFDADVYYPVANGELTVNQASVLVDLADNTYTFDGIGGYRGVVNYDGFIGSDTEALITSGPDFSYLGGDNGGVNAGVYTVTASNIVESSGNYTFDFSDTAILTIEAAPLDLVVTLEDDEQIYDGIGGYRGDVSYSGFAGLDDESIITVEPTFSYSGGDNSGVNVGTYTVSASGTVESTGNYIINESDTAILEILPATVSILLADDAYTYDGVGGYRGDISYVGFVGGDDESLIDNQPQISFTGGDESGVNAGTYTVSAAGLTETTGNYVFNEDDTALLSISPATLIVNLADETKIYDGIGGYTGDIGYSGFVGLDDASDVTAPETFLYDGGDDSGVNAGTYTVSAGGFISGSGNYTFDVSDTAILQIDPATLIVSLADQAYIYDGIGGYSGTIGYSGFVGLDDASDVTAPETFLYDGGDNSGVNAGTYTVSAGSFISESGNYTFDVSDTAILQIDPATLTVSLADQAYVYDGIGGYSGVVSYDGFVGLDTDQIITSGPAFDYAGGDTSGVNVGTYTVSGSGSTESTGNYVFEETDTAILQIDPATLMVDIGESTYTYDGIGGYRGPLSVSGFVASEGAEITVSDPDFEYDSGDGNGIDAGVYVVSTTGFTESSGNYIFDETDTGLLTIETAPLNVTLGDDAYTYDGIGGYRGDISYEGFISGEDESLITGTPSFAYNGEGSSAVDAGTYSVDGFGALEGAENYSVNYINTATLEITPATLTVMLGDNAYEFDGIGGYRGDISYDGFVGEDSESLITSGPSFTYEGGDNSGVNVGSYTVTGSGATESSGNYVFDHTDTAILSIGLDTLFVNLDDQEYTYDGFGGYSGLVTYTGFDEGDDESIITSGPLFTFTGGDESGLNVGTYTVTASGVTESTGNYVFDYTDTAMLTITAATLTLELPDDSNVYDGVGGYQGAVSYSGFVGIDTDALITQGPTFSYLPNDIDGEGDSGFLSSAVNVGDYTVFGSGSAESSGNYIFDEGDTANLEITPATLLVVLADETKTFDGNAGYSSTVSYQGFVAGEDESLIDTSPLISVNGGDGSGGRNVGSYTVEASGTMLTSDNYVVDETDTGTLEVDPKTIIVSLTDDQYTYNGIGGYTGVVSYQGFVSEEDTGLLVGTPAFIYEGGDNSGVNAGTYTVASFGSAESSGNYTFDESATATLQIDRATLNVDMADNTYTYDGVGGYRGAVTVTGFVNQEAGQINLSPPVFVYEGGDESGVNAGSYTVSTTGLSESSGNYVFDVTDTAMLQIDQAVLGVTLADVNRVYDGTDEFSSYTVAGYATGEDATTIGGEPSFDFAYAGGDGSGRNVGTYTVSASGGPVVDNYTFDFLNTAMLDITQRAIFVTLPSEGRPYDANVEGYTLDPVFSNYLLGDEGSVAITPYEITLGDSFLDPNPDGSSNRVTAVSAAGSVVVSNANYTIDFSGATTTLTEEGFTTLNPTPPEQEPFGRDRSRPRDYNANSPIRHTREREPDFVVPQFPNDVIEDILTGKAFCEGLTQSEFTVDCLGDSLEKAAAGLPDSGDYGTVKAALLDASRKLSALAQQNASQSLTRSIARSADGTTSTRQFTPVDSAVAAQINAQASAILDELETVLLRSAQNSERRQLQFQRIAEAVGSNKILLRS